MSGRRIVVGEMPIRVKVMREFGVDFPGPARAVFDWALSQGSRLPMFSFGVDALPPTVNHMYEHVGGRRILTAEALAFRDKVAFAMRGQGGVWRPKGAALAMIFLQSPHWITKKHTIRDMDADNREKALFDAIQQHAKVPDSTNWQHYTSKIASAKIRTSVYLFDLGDVIEWYP